MNQTIDFERIAEDADLPSIMHQYNVEVRHGKAFCPFHENTRDPAMTVYQLGGRWRFECKSSCGVKGDAITFVSMMAGVTKLEAAMEIGGIVREYLRRKGPGLPKVQSKPIQATIAPPWIGGGQGERPRPPRTKPEPWEDPGWQAEVDRIVERAEVRLWGPDGVAALEWLRNRGLKDFAIRRFRLGFVAEPERSRELPGLSGDGRPWITACRGVLIPWVHPEAWYHASETPPGPRWVGCNVRRLADPDVFAPLPDGQEKNFALKGSRRGYLYPFADLVPGLPVVLLEGEWDALLAWQEFGWAVNVATVGGAKQEPKPESLSSLLDCPQWMMAFDNDEAGNEAAKRWSIRSRGAAVRMTIPPGSDLGDMHVAGVDLLEWLKGEFVSLGWTWTLR